MKKKKVHAGLYQKMALWLPPETSERTWSKNAPQIIAMYLTAFIHYTFQKLTLPYRNLPGKYSFNTTYTQWIFVFYFSLCEVPKSHLIQETVVVIHCTEVQVQDIETQCLFPDTFNPGYHIKGYVDNIYNRNKAIDGKGVS